LTFLFLVESYSDLLFFFKALVKLPLWFIAYTPELGDGVLFVAVEESFYLLLLGGRGRESSEKLIRGSLLF